MVEGVGITHITTMNSEQRHANEYDCMSAACEFKVPVSTINGWRKCLQKVMKSSRNIGAAEILSMSRLSTQSSDQLETLAIDQICCSLRNL